LSYKQIQEHFPQRSKPSLILKVKKLLKEGKEVKRSKYKKIEILSTSNLIHCWFAGFFLGDGTIDFKTIKGRLNLAIKDIFLLKFIAKSFKFPVSRVKEYDNVSRLNFSKGFILNLMETFQISANKSYGEVIFPDFLTTQQMKCFLLGLLYSDGNTKISCEPEKKIFAVRFLQSYDFLQKLLKFIQMTGKDNSVFDFSHYDETSISIIETKQSGYDVASLELSGIDSVKFVKWLLEDNMAIIPILERKIKPILEVNINNVRQVPKIPVAKRFTNKKKKKWTNQEIQNLKDYILHNPDHTDEMIAKHFNRTYRAISHQRKKLGLSKNRSKLKKSKSIPYTTEEIIFIENFLKTYPNRDIEVLTKLVKQLNDLPSSEEKSPRTLRGVRSFITNVIDKKLNKF
jgi:hypothetical protein